MTDQILQLALLQLVQVSVVLSLIAMVDNRLGERLPRVRYAMWLVALIKCLTPPVIASPTGMFSWAQTSLQSTPAAAATESLGWVSWVASQLANWPAAAYLLGGVWLAGCVALVWSWSRAWSRFSAATAETQTGVLHRRLSAQLQSLSQQMGINRAPALVLTQQDFGPAMVGWWRPTIVLPRRLASSLSASDVEPLLAHELIHVKRRDSLFGVLQMAVATVWWFHPLVWLALRRFTAALEMRVDERTVDEIGISPSCYAASLLSAIELLCRPAPLPGSQGLLSCRMTSVRIRHLLNPRSPSSRRVALLTAFGLGLLILPGRGLSVPSEWFFRPVPCGQFSAEHYVPPPADSRQP